MYLVKGYSMSGLSLYNITIRDRRGPWCPKPVVEPRVTGPQLTHHLTHQCICYNTVWNPNSTACEAFYASVGLFVLAVHLSGNKLLSAHHTSAPLTIRPCVSHWAIDKWQHVLINWCGRFPTQNVNMSFTWTWLKINEGLKWHMCSVGINHGVSFSA